VQQIKCRPNSRRSLLNVTVFCYWRSQTSELGHIPGGSCSELYAKVFSVFTSRPTSLLTSVDGLKRL
jgi:hypothetical protein